MENWKNRMGIGGIVEMSGYKIRNIIRYMDDMKSYIDEDLVVWERQNTPSWEYIGSKHTESEPTYANNGLKLRNGMEHKVGVEIKQEDLMIVYKKSNDVDSLIYRRIYEGKIIERSKLLEWLLK